MIDLVNKTMEQFTHAQTPAAFLVDQIPILKYVPAWVPGAKFKRVAIDENLTRQAMFDDLYNFAWKNKVRDLFDFHI